jgi:hypothetical protein
MFLAIRNGRGLLTFGFGMTLRQDSPALGALAIGMVLKGRDLEAARIDRNHPAMPVELNGLQKH